MAKGIPRAGIDIKVTGLRAEEFTLHLKVFKSKLVIEDEEGNVIRINKRQRRILIEREPVETIDWFYGDQDEKKPQKRRK